MNAARRESGHAQRAVEPALDADLPDKPFQRLALVRGAPGDSQLLADLGLLGLPDHQFTSGDGCCREAVRLPNRWRPA